MNTDILYKQAMERTNQRIALRHEEIQRKASIPKPRSISEVSAERLAERELEKDAPSTGYPDLDHIIKGFIPGHLYTLTGNENVGKTSLACNFAVRVARQGKKVLYFALEPENMLVEYLASVRTDKRFEDVTDDERTYDDGNIHVFGKEQISKINDLINIVEQLDRYDLVIIDHIGYFVMGDGQNMVQDQSNAVKKLAGLSKAKKCAIMLIAHMRKPPAGSKKNYVPTSNDISGSGAFKQDSTEVMIVVRSVNNPEDGGLEYTSDGILYVTKTKAGPNGMVPLTFSERKANITTLGEQLALARKAEEEKGWKLNDRTEKLDKNW